MLKAITFAALGVSVGVMGAFYFVEGRWILGGYYLALALGEFAIAVIHAHQSKERE